MAIIAAQYGHADALNYLVEALVAHAVGAFWISDPQTAILRVIDFHGAPEDLPAWYQGKDFKLSTDFLSLPLLSLFCELYRIKDASLRMPRSPRPKDTLCPIHTMQRKYAKEDTPLLTLAG
jgi:hypothetical protein